MAEKVEDLAKANKEKGGKEKEEYACTGSNWTTHQRRSPECKMLWENPEILECRLPWQQFPPEQKKRWQWWC